jgi:hypothetical protein
VLQAGGDWETSGRLLDTPRPVGHGAGPRQHDRRGTRAIHKRQMVLWQPTAGSPGKCGSRGEGCQRPGRICLDAGGSTADNELTFPGSGYRNQGRSRRLSRRRLLRGVACCAASLVGGAFSKPQAIGGLADCQIARLPDWQIGRLAAGGPVQWA